MRQPQQRKQSRSALSRPAARYRPRLENLEDRTLMAVDILGSVAPQDALQTLFAPESARLPIHATHLGTEYRLLQFALDGQNFNQAVTFNLAPTDPNSTADAGLGLYDADGNALGL